jgi:hypothetical protein
MVHGIDQGGDKAAKGHGGENNQQGQADPAEDILPVDGPAFPEMGDPVESLYPFIIGRFSRHIKNTFT